MTAAGSAPGSGLALAVDVGGTKLRASLVDHDGSCVTTLEEPTRPLPGEGDPWPVLARMIAHLAERAGDRLAGVGIGSAGPLDLARGAINPLNIPEWVGFPLVERVSGVVTERLRRRCPPVILAGDGLCAAAGEHWRGAGRGVDDLVVVVVSTGVGGGLIKDGVLLAGPSGNAGHVGHIVVDLHGDPCSCGGFGCVESVASGPSLVRWAHAQGWHSDRCPCRPDRPCTAVALAEEARSGESVPRAAFERAGRALGAGLVSAAAVLDARVAVLGGGVARAADLLLPAVRAGIARHAGLRFIRELELRPAALGEDLGTLGAAALVFRPDRYRPGSVSRRAG